MRGKNFELGKFWQMVLNSSNLSLPIPMHMCNKMTEDLPVDSPKFSTPFASSVIVRQNVQPPKLYIGLMNKAFNLVVALN